MKAKRLCILLAAGLLTLSACGTKTPKPVPATDAPTVSETAAVPESTTLTEPAPTEAPTETTAAEQTQPDEPAETTAAPTTAPETTAPHVPQSKAEILKLYNDAVSQAAGRKAGFTKQRSTTTTSYHDSLALKPFRSYVIDFMGLDREQNDSVTAGTEHYERYLRAASLTDADVASAAFTPDEDGGGTITLQIQPGHSSIDGGKDSRLVSPIDRSGIAVGSGDRSEWDHKTAQNAYAAIEGTYAGVKVEESYSDAVIRAKIDKDGALTALDVDFDISFSISKILASRGDAAAHTAIRYTRFQ